MVDSLVPDRSAPERLAAWLITGPLGHLAAGLTDWAVMAGGYVWARARGRDPWE